MYALASLLYNAADATIDKPTESRDHQSTITSRGEMRRAIATLAMKPR